MPTATVINMRARPLQASHLCFEVGGILGELNVQLERYPSALNRFWILESAEI